MNTEKKLHLFACITFAVVIGVVVLGAFTRLVHAGLGCPDWPTCYGHIWVPNSADEISQANQNFSQTPVETDKTWPEQAHRLLASTLGLLILAIYLFTYFKTPIHQRYQSIVIYLGILVGATMTRIFVGDAMDSMLLFLILGYFANLLRLQMTQTNTSSTPQKLAGLTAGFVILQGWFGMWTVTLYLWPQVVTTHLLGGFTTLSLVWLLKLRSDKMRWVVRDGLVHIKRLKPVAFFVLGLVIFQIALGGWTTSNYAALACMDLPKCHGEWFPDMNFSEGFNFFQHVGPNYLGGIMDNAARTAIHFSHRVGALFTTLGVLILAGLLVRTGHNFCKRWALLLLIGVGVQVVLGISNIIFGLPLYVAVAHNAGGALLLVIVVTVVYKILTAKQHA